MKENKFWKTRRLNAPERSEGVYKFKCFGGPRRGGGGGLLPEKLFWGCTAATQNPYFIYVQNGQNRYTIYHLNGGKTVP